LPDVKGKWAVNCIDTCAPSIRMIQQEGRYCDNDEPIEQAVIDAMCIAYSDRLNPGRDFTTEDILSALARQVPLSRSQREAIGALRQWLAEGRAQSASFLKARQVREQCVQIQIDPRQGP